MRALIFQGEISGEALMLNGMYANVPGTGRVLTSKAKAWKKAAATELMRFAPFDKGPLDSDQRLHLELTFYGRWEDKKGLPIKKDADGATKAPQDVLCAYLGIDDRRIYRVSSEKVHAPPEQARTVLCLYALPK